MGGARAKKGGQQKNKNKGKGAKHGGSKNTPGCGSVGVTTGLTEQDGASAVPSDGSSPTGRGRVAEAASASHSESGESDSEFVYTFADAAAEAVSIVHDDSGAVLSESGERAWSWRQWDGGKCLARYLEQSCRSEVAGQVVVELGAGTGLVSLVAARLGAAGVAATDLAHGMDLLKHNVGRNLLDTGGKPELGAAAAGGNSEATACCCPEGHALLSRAAECEDYICNVCDSDIDEGGTLWSCTKERCDGFDLCGNCERKARSCAWAGLPTWFKVQSQVHQARSTAARVTGETDARTMHAFLYERRFRGTEEEGEESTMGTLLVEELDWSDESAVTRLYGSLAKAGLPNQLQACGMLVLGADLSYDRDTIVLLVHTISRLKLSDQDATKAAAATEGSTGGNKPVRSMLLVHDKRNAATTEFLLEQLASAGLMHTLENHARAAESFGLPADRMMLMRIALS